MQGAGPSHHGQPTVSGQEMGFSSNVHDSDQDNPRGEMQEEQMRSHSTYLD